jgi:hypothetical protein
VDWLRRTGRNVPPAVAATDRSAPGPVERPAPGVAALFEGVGEDRRHAILDLGPAAASNFKVYSRFARWVRFADLLGAASSREGWAAARDALPLQPERPYDLVLGWDVLDRLPPEERPRLVERLVELTAPGARLYVVVESSPEPTAHLLRFELLDTDRMSYEATALARPVWPPLLPSKVERLLMPFQVRRAFTSRVGLREYVAVRV